MLRLMLIQRRAVLAALLPLLAGCGAQGTQVDAIADASPAADAAVSARQGGLSVDLDVEHLGAGRAVLVRFAVRDDNGAGPGFALQYGDGEQDQIVLAQGSCPGPEPLPGEPATPLDKVVERRHEYAEAGSYSLTLKVVSERQCTDVPTESVDLTTTVKIE